MSRNSDRPLPSLLCYQCVKTTPPHHPCRKEGSGVIMEATEPGSIRNLGCGQDAPAGGPEWVAMGRSPPRCHPGPPSHRRPAPPPAPPAPDATAARPARGYLGGPLAISYRRFFFITVSVMAREAPACACVCAYVCVCVCVCAYVGVYCVCTCVSLTQSLTQSCRERHERV